MEPAQRFAYLLKKYLEQTASTEECDAFFAMLLTHEYDALLKERIGQDYEHAHQFLIDDLPPSTAHTIMKNILDADKSTRQVLRARRRLTSRFWWAAACIAALLVCGTYFFSILPRTGGTYELEIPSNSRTVKNNTPNVQQFTLADGSSITLQPGAVIHYPVQFNDSLREVYLEGNALFEVKPDASKPFLVYCRNTVTRVLGTKFNIITNEKEKNVEVAVIYGKVQVYKNKSHKEAEKDVEKSVILTANQKAVYNETAETVTATLVVHPVPIDHSRQHTPDSSAVKPAPAAVRVPFVYDQTRLESVFDDIKTVYGIDMEAENTNLYHCLFTGDVSNKDLFGLLRVICLSINASYEINGTKILIKGKGCPP